MDCLNSRSQEAYHVTLFWFLLLHEFLRKQYSNIPKLLNSMMTATIFTAIQVELAARFMF